MAQGHLARPQVRVVGVGLLDVRLQQLGGGHGDLAEETVAAHVAVVPHLVRVRVGGEGEGEGEGWG